MFFKFLMCTWFLNEKQVFFRPTPDSYKSGYYFEDQGLVFLKLMFLIYAGHYCIHMFRSHSSLLQKITGSFMRIFIELHFSNELLPFITLQTMCQEY